MKLLFNNGVRSFVTRYRAAHRGERHRLKTVLVDIYYYVQVEKEHTRTNELL